MNAKVTVERSAVSQMYRSGTSVGANMREARFAESKADYIHKLKIAEKELAEFTYWLGVLSTPPQIIESVDSDRLVTRVREIRALLSATIRTLKNNRP
ncbi:MAG: four helix bundle protein [Ignavibacteria bacterium]|nr:four helix bundle protein [Ignavibacteria bacterium]